ncbi:hypothetical protein DCC62_00485 [candidate division KSB1 bacterium]|nr:MAG: hypothetical protein DCC62_00485 [candidate division KSB1 bacterium]
MKVQVCSLAVLLSLCFTSRVEAQNYKLPFLPNETWSCNQGNADDPGNTAQDPNITHLSTNSMKFAWDFNWGSEDDDLGKPYIIPRAGFITRTAYASGWGNYVVIQFVDGKYGKAAHLSQVFVKIGEYVQQGEVIGLVGGTPNWSPHIHWQEQVDGTINGQSTPSGYQEVNYTAPVSNIRNMPTVGVAVQKQSPSETTNRTYTSANTSLFNAAYTATGSIPLENYGWWDSWTSNDYTNVYYAAVIDGLSNGHVVYDAMRGARSAVHIFGQMWTQWSGLGGPNSYLATPIDEEYLFGGYTIQDCQGGYLRWNGEFGVTEAFPYPEWFGPGAFDPSGGFAATNPQLLLQNLPGGSGPTIAWSPVVSYQFAECFKLNGKSANLGWPYAGVFGTSPAAVHKWNFTWSNGQSDFYWVQNFKNGAYGDCIIMYDPDNTGRANQSTIGGENKAYLLRGNIWNDYRDNNWISILGAPVAEQNGNRQDFQLGYAEDTGSGAIYTLYNPGLANLRVDSNPSGGIVLVNGQEPYSGATTPTSLFTIAAGSHAVSVHFEGHLETITVPTQADVITNAQVAVGGFGFLSVTTVPDGAEVRLNGNRWPTSTSLTNISATALAAGIYTLRIAKTGYEPIEYNITISDEQTTAVSEILVLSSGQPIGAYLPTAEPYQVHFEIWDTDNLANPLHHGDTPFPEYLLFAADTLKVQFTKDGYASWDTVFAVVPEDYKEIHGVLTYTAGTPTPELQVASFLFLSPAYAGLQHGTIVLTNTGTKRLTGTVAASGNGEIDQTSFMLKIGYSLSLDVRIDFDSLDPGSYVDSVMIASDGGNETVAVHYEKRVEAGTKVLVDSFNRSSIGSTWSVTAGNAVELIDHEIILSSSGSTNGVATATFAGALNNCSVEFTMRPTQPSGNRVSRVYLRYSDENNYYCLSSWRSYNLIFLDKMVNGTRIRSTIFNKSLVQGRYHFAVVNDTLHFYNVGGTGTIFYGTLEDTTLGSVPAGYVSFFANEENLAIDDVVVVDLDATPSPDTPSLTIAPGSLHLGSASSGVLADSLFLSSIGTATVGGSVWANGYLLVESPTITLEPGAEIYFPVSVNLDSLALGSRADTVRIAYNGMQVAVPVTYERLSEPDATLLGIYNMDGALASNAKRTNAVSGNFLIERFIGSTTGLNSMVDGAYSFTKTNWSRLITDLDLELNGRVEFSLEAWVSFNNSGNNVVMGRPPDGSLQLEWQGSNAPVYVCINGICGFTTNIQRDQDVWYYLAVTFDGNGSTNSNKLKLYINGVQENLTYSSSIPNSLPDLGSAPLILGYFKDENVGTSSLGGKIAAVRVSNCVRSESEIAESTSTEFNYSVTPSSLSFTVESAVDTVYVTSVSATAITKSASWLTLSTSTTQGINQLVVVSADSTGLDSGIYQDTLNVTGDGSVMYIPVAFSILAEGSGPFSLDGSTLGLWDMDGTLASSAKRTNVANSTLLTETSVGSSIGLEGEVDGAYSFTKSNWSRLIIDLDSELNSLTQFSFEAWVSFNNSGNNVVMGRDNGNCVQLEWQGSNSPLYVFVGSSYGYTGNVPRTQDSWYYLAVTFNGNNSGNSDRLKLYVNGELQSLTFSGTVPSALPNSGTTPLILGYYKDENAGTSSLGGTLAAVRVSNIARTSTEVSDAYQDGLGKRNSEYQDDSLGLIPAVFKLYQNYPNPFNPTTTFRYDLPEDSHVSLAIFNFLGQRVKLLVDQEVKAGRHSVVWDMRSEEGTKLPSGVYFYQLIAGGFTEAKKMTLVK